MIKTGKKEVLERRKSIKRAGRDFHLVTFIWCIVTRCTIDLLHLPLVDSLRVDSTDFFSERLNQPSLLVGYSLLDVSTLGGCFVLAQQPIIFTLNLRSTLWNVTTKRIRLRPSFMIKKLVDSKTFLQSSLLLIFFTTDERHGLMRLVVALHGLKSTFKISTIDCSVINTLPHAYRYWPCTV